MPLFAICISDPALLCYPWAFCVTASISSVNMDTSLPHVLMHACSTIILCCIMLTDSMQRLTSMHVGVHILVKYVWVHQACLVSFSVYEKGCHTQVTGDSPQKWYSVEQMIATCRKNAVWITQIHDMTLLTHAQLHSAIAVLRCYEQLWWHSWLHLKCIDFTLQRRLQ